MEKLSVYEDYIQSMTFLHASRNRLVNAVETSRLSAEDGKYITEACLKLYKAHTQTGCDKIEALASAVKGRLADDLQTAMQAVHKHNRQTMRLSKIFEEDVCDFHPDPDDPIDEDAPKIEADLSLMLPSTKIRSKLQSLIEKI